MNEVTIIALVIWLFGFLISLATDIYVWTANPKLIKKRFHGNYLLVVIYILAVSLLWPIATQIFCIIYNLNIAKWR